MKNSIIRKGGDRMELLFLPVILIVLFMLYQKGKFDKGEYKNNILVYLT